MAMTEKDMLVEYFVEAIADEAGTHPSALLVNMRQAVVEAAERICESIDRLATSRTTLGNVDLTE
jgi:hypothetical protein